MEKERRVNLRVPVFTDVILRPESFDCVVVADLVNQYQWDVGTGRAGSAIRVRVCCGDTSYRESQSPCHWRNTGQSDQSGRAGGCHSFYFPSGMVCPLYHLRPLLPTGHG